MIVNDIMVAGGEGGLLHTARSVTVFAETSFFLILIRAHSSLLEIVVLRQANYDKRLLDRSSGMYSCRLEEEILFCSLFLALCSEVRVNSNDDIGIFRRHVGKELPSCFPVLVVPASRYLSFRLSFLSRFSSV